MTTRTPALILALLQKVRDKELTPEQGTETLVRAIQAAERCHQETQQTLMGHLLGSLR